MYCYWKIPFGFLSYLVQNSPFSQIILFYLFHHLVSASDLCRDKKNHTLKFHGLSQCLAYFILYTIILLCFVGTWRGLSHSTSLTSHKRKLILVSLSLVLMNYTFLILPNAFKGFIKSFGFSVSQRISNFFLLSLVSKPICWLFIVLVHEKWCCWYTGISIPL